MNTRQGSIRLVTFANSFIVVQRDINLRRLGSLTADLRCYGPYNLAVLIAFQRAANSQVGVDYRGQLRSNLSKTKNIPPKAVIFSDFCCIFAMSLMILLVLQH